MDYKCIHRNFPCQTEERKVSPTIIATNNTHKKLVMWGVRKGQQAQEKYGMNEQIKREYDRVMRILINIVVMPNQRYGMSDANIELFKPILYGYEDYFKEHGMSYSLEELRAFRNNIVRILDGYAQNYGCSVLFFQPKKEESPFDDDMEDFDEDFCL